MDFDYGSHGPWCGSRTIPVVCECGADVFWFRCDCGCSVYFDCLGEPWPVHHCWIEDPSAIPVRREAPMGSRQESARPVRVSPKRRPCPQCRVMMSPEEQIRGKCDTCGGRLGTADDIGCRGSR
jgi:hypothetical protein